MNRARAVAVGTLVAVLAHGCGNGSSCKGVIAGLPGPPLEQQLYPSPGATNVPTNVGVILYANTSAYPPLTTAVFNGLTQVPATAIPVPSPMPSGAATPYPGFQVQALAVGTLAPEATYTLMELFHAPIPETSCLGVTTVTSATFGGFATK